MTQVICFCSLGTGYLLSGLGLASSLQMKEDFFICITIYYNIFCKYHFRRKLVVFFFLKKLVFFLELFYLCLLFMEKNANKT